MLISPNFVDTEHPSWQVSAARVSDAANNAAMVITSAHKSALDIILDILCSFQNGF
jgi:hypothetical protein